MFTRLLKTNILCLVISAATCAAEEPLLNIYNWADYIGPTTIADFEKEFGIKVNYDIYDTSEIVDAKLMAGNTGYDLVFHAAGFSARFLPHGIHQPLDKSKIPNLKFLHKDLMRKFEAFDPGNRFSVPYMWGTTGYAYNVDMIMERMPDAPLHSSALFFDPEVVSRFADCGVTILASPINSLALVMLYLGYPAESLDPGHLKQAEQVLKSIRPYIRYISSAKMLIDMPNKEVCLSMSWSGDFAVAAIRAKEAGIDINLAYSVPAEGTYGWFDAMYIPADAARPDNAHKFINYILRPEVIAEVTNFTGYANINPQANRFVKPEFLNDPAIYPDDDVINRMHPMIIQEPKLERRRSRLWTRFKSGL